MATGSKQRVLLVARPAFSLDVMKALEPVFAVESVGSDAKARRHITGEPRSAACLVDAELDDGAGIAFVEWLLALAPGLPTLLIATAATREAIAAAGRLAVPLVPWPFDPLQLAEILNTAEIRALGYVEHVLRKSFDETARAANLTAEQRDVSWTSLLGATAKQVAASRSVSVRTVESQRYEVLKKLHLASTDEMRWKLLAQVLPDWRRGR